jgi:hypothetical protein
MSASRCLFVMSTLGHVVVRSLSCQFEGIATATSLNGFQTVGLSESTGVSLLGVSRVAPDKGDTLSPRMFASCYQTRQPTKQ